MTVAQRHVAQQYAGGGGPSGLADVLEVLLDKGLVIDAYVRVSLVGIELLTVDARVVVASVDTYLRFAEAVNRLDLTQASNAQTLGDLVSGGSTKSPTARRSENGGASGDNSSNGRSDDRTADAQGRSDERARDSEDDSTPRAAEERPPEEVDQQVDQQDDQQDDVQGLLSKIKQRGQAF